MLTLKEVKKDGAKVGSSGGEMVVAAGDRMTRERRVCEGEIERRQFRPGGKRGRKRIKAKARQGTAARETGTV